MAKSLITPLLVAPFILAAAAAQTPATEPTSAAPSPSEIVAAAAASDWADIDAADLLVMDLAPDRAGHPRRVVIQLLPPPFAQGWVGNIRVLAAAHWWDGTSINRVQDNYVAQWGDADGENAAKAKPLPSTLATVPQSAYVALLLAGAGKTPASKTLPPITRLGRWPQPDAYVAGGAVLNTGWTGFSSGWPVAARVDNATPSRSAKNGVIVAVWPIHCYRMVGVGRNLPPDTGTGAELYTVIGHAPRQLDRNIALVGRVVAGIEYLSSLPRGTGPLGFYETAEERVPITSMRIATDLPAANRPQIQYLKTDSASFARYADARANRRDPFYLRPAGGVDICNVPVPIRAWKAP